MGASRGLRKGRGFCGGRRILETPELSEGYFLLFGKPMIILETLEHQSRPPFRYSIKAWKIASNCVGAIPSFQEHSWSSIAIDSKWQQIS
jgi:hypothetical protein